MADAKQYAVAQGIVQKFGDKPAVVDREVSGQTLKEFTIKSLNTQALVRVTLWPELGSSASKVVKGALVAVDGQASSYQGKDGQTYHSITAREIVIVPPEAKADREVVNNGNTAAPAQATASGPGF